MSRTTASAPFPWTPADLGLGLGIAIPSSLLPYSLELIILRRMPAAAFGIFLSLERAIAALAGLLVLGQRLHGLQLLGMALVVAASVVVLGRPDEPVVGLGATAG